MKITRNPWFNFLLSENYTNFAVLFLRLFVGFMLLRHGIDKIQNFETLKATFPDPIGWGSQLSLVFVILTEVGCSLAVMLGFLTRLALIPLIFSMALVAFVVHSPFSVSGSELPLMYLGIFIALFLTGPRKWSVDSLLYKMFGKESEEL